MPSASAKLEKQISTESHDPMKQVVSLVEKKVRNLEKRKVRLDNLKLEASNGKELNEDQQNAITKYDQVVEILDFSKDMQKSIQIIIQDCAKFQKKQAKREQVERQQQEVHRIQEMLRLQELLNNMGTDNVRQDFLTGAQGAVQLSQEDLDRLDELYKLVSPERDSEKGNFESQLSASAEHLVGLLDGRNKEVLAGATYKSMKELLNKINNSEYFSHTLKEEEEDMPAVVEKDQPIEPSSPEIQPDAQQMESNFYAMETAATPYVGQALPEVLHVQGNFNFLQDSQVDVDTAPIPTPYPPAVHPAAAAAHVDPAVVAAQPVSTFHSAVAGAQEEFDPVGPIPTQTFTNQNFAMQGIVATAYVQPTRPAGPPATVAAPEAVQEPETFIASIPEYQPVNVSPNVTSQPAATATQYQSSDDNEDGGEGPFTQQGSRGGFRGRGNRGPRPSNGHTGRGGRGYSNGRGGGSGYQNSGGYYGGNRDRDNYSSGGNQRRGSGRAAPRGGGGPRGGGRGSSNYRPQQ